MTISEAFTEYNGGSRVRRASWGDTVLHRNYRCTSEDKAATDWEVEQETFTGSGIFVWVAVLT